MDLTSNATTITTTVKTPEPETETPTRIQPAKPISFSNGVLKRHNPLNHHHHHVFNNNHHHPVVVIYKECLKNHAATLGGHAVDGCGEFMPSPTATPADPTSLKCAACGCHRNFHRREPEEPFPPPNTTAALEYQPHHRHHPLPPPPPQQRGSGGHSTPNSPSPPPISSAYYPASAPHMLLALSAGLSGAPVENIPPISVSANPMSVPLPNPNGRKRHRTKFTQDQKERMLEFAERVGWKIQKRDEKLISDFCTEVGVEKGVLKVWMHNNKNTFGKRSDQADGLTGAGDGAVNGGASTTPNNLNGNANNGISFGFGSRNNTHDSTDSEFHLHHESSNDSDKGHTNHNSSQGLNNHLIHNNDIVSAHVVVATNGSSSST